MNTTKHAVSKEEISRIVSPLYPMEDFHAMRHARGIITSLSKGGTDEEKKWLAEALPKVVERAVTDAVAEDEEGKPKAAMGLRAKACNYFDDVRTMGTQEEKDLALDALKEVVGQELSKGNVTRGASGDYRIEYAATAFSSLCDVRSVEILVKAGDRFKTSGNKDLVGAARRIDAISTRILDAEYRTKGLSAEQAADLLMKEQDPKKAFKRPIIDGEYAGDTHEDFEGK